ncbi:MAG: hypothetical protein Q8P67_04880, partial [archaeon]|nr:hypothetical protein [archaeon]
MAHLLGLSCRRVKLISCSSHFLVVTQEPGGGELLWTWGSNDAGQCGVGEELGCESKGGQLRPIPYLSTAQIAMRSPQPISAVACSRSASLVLRSSGVLLWCGSLPSPSPHRPQMSFTSVSVHQGDIRSICAGEAHLAAVVETAEGSRQVVTWGLNTHGQLGHGKALNTFVGSPTAVAFAWPSPVVQVCSGARHMLALLQNGRVYAWGKNVHTSIADTVPVEKKPRILGTRAQEMALMAPTKVVLGHAKSTLKGCISERLPVVMTASDSFSVISTPKKSWSWGECRYGGLGHGPQVFYVPSPSTPHLYPDNIVDITCGSRHTLFLDSSKRLYAMGYGRHGSLGVELSSSALSTPTLVTTFSNVPFQVSMMAAGESASLALMNLEPNPELTALFTPDSHLRFSDLVAPPSSAPPSPASSSSLASLSTSSSSSSSSSPPNATDAELIPSIVSQTLDYLEADSARISYEGIFRVEGLAQEKKIIERLWQTGEPLADFPDQYLSVPNLTFALKSFFRALPPLIPFDDFELFFQAASRSNVHDRVFSLGQRARQLPPGHWAILRRLYLHGMIVIANEPRNRMNLEAVSRMWGNMTLRNPDQSDKGLMRQGEVGAVAKPLLAYGHIIFDDFLWSLYLALYVSVGGESALAICDLLAKETRSPQDEAEWLRQLTTPRTGPTTTPDLPAMEQELAGFQGRLQALKDAACASATGQQLIAHITEAFELFDGIDTLLFSEQTHLIFWIVSVVLRSLRSTMWNVPVRHTRRTFRREGTLPHPISKMNFNFLGEDPF